MLQEYIFGSLIVFFITFGPLCWSIGDYFQQKAYTEMRNRGDKTFFEWLREKSKTK